MITDFDDLCLWTYVVVDDMLIKLAPLLRRPGPCPDCSDSELITMILIAECKGWDIETQLLSEFSQHPNLFPILPCQSRFNRRRRNLGVIINRIRQMLLSDIEAASDKLCIIDSLPIPVMQFHLVHPRHQMIGHAMVPIMVESNPRNGPFSAINCIC